MNYAKMSEKELNDLRFAFICKGNHNAAREISDFKEVYNKRVKVVKGRKVPHGTEGIVFLLKDMTIQNTATRGEFIAQQE